MVGKRWITDREDHLPSLDAWAWRECAGPVLWADYEPDPETGMGYLGLLDPFLASVMSGQSRTKMIGLPSLDAAPARGHDGPPRRARRPVRGVPIAGVNRSARR